MSKMVGSPWLYHGEPFLPENVTEDMSGFVYLITNNRSGRKYIGKKIIQSKRKLPPLKGKKRKRIVVKQSDWMKYWGSSKYLQEDIKEIGIENFSREILFIGNTKSLYNYVERLLQLKFDVLHTTLPNGERAFYNENIDRVFYNSNTLPIKEIEDEIESSSSRRSTPH